MSDTPASTSPTSGKKLTQAAKLLNFPQAIAEVIAGQKITRQEWDDQGYHSLLQDGRLKLQKPDGIFDWVISDGDLLATDWFVIQPK